MAVGALDFEPGVLKSADTLRVLAEPGAVEVPLAIRQTLTWPDGSLLSAEIAFPVHADDSAKQFWAEWGTASRTRSCPAKADPGVPEVTFTPGLDVQAGRPVMDMPVGQLIVRLDQHPGYYYYWYLLPIAAIVALLIYRKARLR